jgi:hypothetical protein
MEIFPDQTQCEHAQNDPEYLGLKIKKNRIFRVITCLHICSSKWNIFYPTDTLNVFIGCISN